MMRRCIQKLTPLGSIANSNEKTSFFTVKNGKRYVTVRKMNHPIRNQSIMLVPVPNLANKTFYDEWCYQPYMKHHTLVICNDISTPAHVYGYRWFVGTKSGIRIFQLVRMLGPMELNLTRKDFTKRLIPLSNSVFRLTFLTARYRSQTCELTVIRHLRALFGSHYTHHSVSLESTSKDIDSPRNDSFVLLFNSSWTPHAVKHLEKEYGFETIEEVDVPIGQEDQIERIERICHTCNTILVTWIAAQFVILVLFAINYFIETGREELVKLKDVQASK